MQIIHMPQELNHYTTAAPKMLQKVHILYADYSYAPSLKDRGIFFYCPIS